MVVTAAFFLPLFVALFFGRAFCGGVCALGAIQELVVLKPVQVPRRLDRALGLLKYVYLGAAIFFAVKPLVARDFMICRFDPFVGFFRMSGAPHMLFIGGAFLAAGMFIGRPYCRWLCPYGVLLSWCTRLSRRGVTITPDNELDCGLCTDACPYGAIEKMRAVRKDCLYCARCYASCPRDGELAKAKKDLVTLS
jgi:NosR/NirI family nitrous oxide reductase transcriptional regulator